MMNVGFLHKSRMEDPFEFRMTIKTSSPNEEFALWTNDSRSNYRIDWGNGVTESLQGELHPSTTYATAGTYHLKIQGYMPAFQTDYNHAAKVISLDNWGSTGLTNLDYAFSACLNLIRIAPDIPPGVTSFYGFARNCKALKYFDGSKLAGELLNISQMFLGCSSLEYLDTSKWQLDNAKFAQETFKGCSALSSYFNPGQWWNRQNPDGTPNPYTVFSDCFTDSLKIENYSEIPANWKGV